MASNAPMTVPPQLVDAAAGAPASASDLPRFVESLIASLHSYRTPPVRTLVLALRGLSMYVQKVQSEVFAAGSGDIKTQHLPDAADELEAIVEATATASDTIMDATEAVQTVAQTLDGEAQQALYDASTRIFEACAFQDITGQRVTKVVLTLRQIEEKIDALAAVVGSNLRRSVGEVAEKPSSELRDDDLCNGPQLPELAKTQAEIDALFDDM